MFLTTARATQLYAQLFQGIGFPALEIHSRKSQAARTRTSEEFRKGTRVVLFTSDVSARGVDYPDVSMVLQVITKAAELSFVQSTCCEAKVGWWLIQRRQRESRLWRPRLRMLSE